MAEAAPAPTRARWPERLTLRDGADIDIRPIRRSDKQRLRAGFERLRPESRYRRFLGPMPQLSSGLLRYLTEVDHHDHEALGALDADTGDGVGIARFVRLDDEANVAEVAVAVVDDWQERGVATELLQRLATRAREEGIDRFSATCLAENREAIELFEEFGTARIGKAQSGLIEAEIDLPIETGLRGAFREALRGAAARRLTFRPPRARRSNARRRAP